MAVDVANTVKHRRTASVTSLRETKKGCDVSNRAEIDPIVTFGAGQYGLTVLELAKSLGLGVAAFVDKSLPEGSNVQGIPVVGFAALRSRFSTPPPAVVAIGNCMARERVSSRVDALGMKRPTLIHPGAEVSPSAEIAPGCIVQFASLVWTGAVLGRGVILSPGAYVTHDAVVGDNCMVANQASVGGQVRVGARVLVGQSASLCLGVSVGDDAVVGAGAVVVRDVGAGQVVAGVPARVLSQGEIDGR